VLCSKPLSELVEEVIARGALTADTLHAVIDATQAHDKDGLYCMVCGGRAFCKDGCPIEQAYDVIGFRTEYICAGCGRAMIDPYRHASAFFFCADCYPNRDAIIENGCRDIKGVANSSVRRKRTHRSAKTTYRCSH
jgi:hypothetical protein